MLSKVGLPWLGCCVRFAGLGLLLFPVLSPILAGMLCPPPYCLRSCLLACLPSWLGCRVCVLGLSPKFHVRFVQLFGVYGGVIFLAGPTRREWGSLNLYIGILGIHSLIPYSGPASFLSPVLGQIFSQHSRLPMMSMVSFRLLTACWGEILYCRCRRCRKTTTSTAIHGQKWVLKLVVLLYKVTFLCLHMFTSNEYHS